MSLRVPRQVLLPCLLLVSLGQVPTTAQTRDEVDAAIAKGVGWLLSAQTTDGSFRGSQFEHYRGFTAFCAYTLLKCGVPPDHPAIEAAFSWLERQDLHRTYDLGCALMAYEALGDSRPMAIVKEYAKKLVRSAGNGQRRNGDSPPPRGTAIFSARPLASSPVSQR